MSHLKKPLTLTYFFLLLSLFVAYRVGAFDFKSRQQAQNQQSQSAQDTTKVNSKAAPYTMSSSKSIVLLSDPSRHMDSNVRKSIQRIDAQDQKRREILMSSSKSAVMFPVEEMSRVQYDSLLLKHHKDSVKQK
jgi:hypothetical protein